jgi:peptide/nickel transport system substrate-binding protein
MTKRDAPRARPLTTRRGVLAGAAAAAPLGMLARPAIAQSDRTRLLRYVPTANLTFTDPTITTAGVSAVHGYAVFDTLYGLDNQLRPRPQMAEGHEVSADGRTWTFRLREGLRFHDGEPVRSPDVIASIRRWGARDAFGQALINFTDRMEAVDDRSFRIHLKRPMGALLQALSHSTPIALFILPERLAVTDPFRPVTEITGSGPYRFLASEYVSGSKVAYARNTAYVPRAEAPEFTSGGKVAHFDRIEWSIIPDTSTVAAALQSGEVDWWEFAADDLLPLLRRNPAVQVQDADPYGLATLLRFNFLHPPFNNVAIRRVVLEAAEQEDFLKAIVGADSKAYTLCYSMFGCGLPGVKEFDGERLRKPRDMAALRQALTAAGYRGEKVVVLDPIDYSFLSSGSRLAADLMRRLGMNVELVSTDFGTLLQRRNSREPVERGGWSVFCTGAYVLSLADPGNNYYIRGAGGWSGWYLSPEVERLTDDWLAEPDTVKQQATFEALQRLSMSEVPMVPLGMWKPQTAFRRNLTGVVTASSSVFWNVRKS